MSDNPRSQHVEVPRPPVTPQADDAAVVDTLDTRLSGQVDKRVDSRVDEVLKDRLSVLERAVADLDRTVKELQERLKD